uniref:Uncharacterized protein n=1 Tax=Glossina austeni TaxID=7395 RepID=A0A1A9V947_GLOAU
MLRMNKKDSSSSSSSSSSSVVEVLVLVSLAFVIARASYAGYTYIVVSLAEKRREVSINWKVNFYSSVYRKLSAFGNSRLSTQYCSSKTANAFCYEITRRRRSSKTRRCLSS